MRALTSLLLQVYRLSWTYPRVMVAVFLVLGAAGFASMPMIRVSTNIIAGVGESNPVINLTKENNDIFGEQDSLIVVLEFPEPPGEARLPIIKHIAESLGKIQGVRRVRFRFLDPDDSRQVNMVMRNFLLGMNDRERSEIMQILTPQGMTDALRRNINRLFLSENPHIQDKILEDPLELGQFIARSMERRVGSVTLGDLHLLIASPDSTVYLIQVTPSFPSADLVLGKELLGRVRSAIPESISGLGESDPSLAGKLKDLKWHLTGKTVFQQESDAIFDEEASTILLVSLGLVGALLLWVYRSGWSCMLLMAPLAAGIGPNYALIYLCWDDVNPVVMASNGVLFALGTEYGVHFWGRFIEGLGRGLSNEDSLQEVYEHTAPAVAMGAITAGLAFLCLCLSHQPAMVQFGYVGASGVILTFLATLFLFPSPVKLARTSRRDFYPRMQVQFRALSGLYLKRPKAVLAVSAVIIVLSAAFACRVSYEKDLFKVFLADKVDSMSVSGMISRKFQTNFSNPTLLSFDIADHDAGLVVQRQLDTILQGLMNTEHEITSFDSISYLMSPADLRSGNAEALASAVRSWPELKGTLGKNLAESVLSPASAATMEKALDSTGEIIAGLRSPASAETEQLAELERSWYVTRIRGSYRFLTQVRYSDEITDPGELKQVDRKIVDAVKVLPVQVHISGTRQVMEAILSGLVSDLMRLGIYAYCGVTLFFFAVFPHPLGVALCLIPMTGAFCITLGAMGAAGMGLPFSIVGVAPLVFGLGLDNGIHVVMGSLYEENPSVEQTMARVTHPLVFTALTTSMGFVAMVTSRHYSLKFLGWSMVVGIAATAALALTTLPALLLLLERRKQRGPGDCPEAQRPD